MSWFDIIKGKYISRKVLREIKDAIESVNGVTIDSLTFSKKTQHLKYKLTYDGPDTPTNKPVKFVLTTCGRNLGKIGNIRSKIRQNIRVALERKDTFITEW